MKKRGKDILVIGTATDLMAYNVLRNSDVFFKKLTFDIRVLLFHFFFFFLFFYLLLFHEIYPNIIV